MFRQALQAPERKIARLSAFLRRDDGSMIVFSMFLLVLMLMLGGLAVDLMRYEQRRTALQQTIDRSVLAAASLTQDLDPEEVVNDYFEKAGLLEHLDSVTVTEGLNFRIVEAEAQAELDPFFAQMVGIDRFDVPATSAAEQRITNVEIALVLDVSGSMLGTKIANLKTAAKEFVSTVLNNDTDDRISITLVPYNGQVNLGQTLREHFNATYQHGTADVNCVDLPASAYTNETLPTTLELPMTVHGDTYSSTTTSTTYVAIQGMYVSSGKYLNNWCPPSTGNVISVMQGNVATLHTKIDALEAIGATSINAGMRWGMALLDPAMQPLMSDLSGHGLVPADFANRPFAWNDDEAMKIIVLMTDGSHFAEERLNNDYKTGMAPIWYSATDNAFAIQHTTGRPSSAGSNTYYYPHRNSGSGEWRSSVLSGYTQQTWPQVWARARMKWVAWQLYARALGTSSSTRTSVYNTWVANFRTQTAISDMDNQLQTICNMAKAREVIVYGIAFEAPDAGEAQIRACSSTLNHYFESSTTNIASAFRAIASNISQLRLTQ
jgi:hypothetical protein